MGQLDGISEENTRVEKNNHTLRTVKRQVITDQSDPRMIEFRESYGEFKPGCKRKTIRLEITEYAPSAGRQKVTTKLGYYEGEPPPEYRQFFRKLLSDASGKTDSWPPTVERGR